MRMALLSHFLYVVCWIDVVGNGSVEPRGLTRRLYVLL